MGWLLHLPHGIKVGWGSLQCTWRETHIWGKNKTPQSKNGHGGSSFKGVHSKNSSTVRPNYSWGTEPPFHSPEKSQCTNMLQVKQLDCFCGTSLIGWKEFLVSIWGLSSSIPKFYVKSIVLIYIIHCVHHTSPQHKITAALLQAFPLGTQAKCISKRQKQHFFWQDHSPNGKSCRRLFSRFFFRVSSKMLCY